MISVSFSLNDFAKKFFGQKRLYNRLGATYAPSPPSPYCEGEHKKHWSAQYNIRVGGRGRAGGGRPVGGGVRGGAGRGRTP